MSRPLPPEELIEEGGSIRPAPEVFHWLSQTILDRVSPLFNEDHRHLEGAFIGCLWTNIKNARQMRQVLATAEVPFFKGNAWTKARQELQLKEWFGTMPD